MARAVEKSSTSLPEVEIEVIDLTTWHTSTGQPLLRCLVDLARAREMATQTANTYQINRAHHMIAETYPQGTEGVSTTAIHRRLIEIFGAACEKEGTKVPSRGSIARALGRRK